MKKTEYFIGAIIFQLLILAGMIGMSAWPLYTGKPIRLKVVPVDPRDLFRGDYVVLNYDFSRLNLSQFKHNLKPGHEYHFGDVLYLELQKTGIHYEPLALFAEKPGREGTFLQVINQNNFTFRPGNSYNRIWLKAGIESYFTDSETAKALETKVRDRKIEVSVTVMVTGGGRARIQQVHYPEIKKTD